MNDIVLAIRQQPDILKQIVTDPHWQLNNHESYSIERQAFKQINIQAFGKRRFANAKHSTRKNYYRFLSPIEVTAMRFEKEVMRDTVLQGHYVYQEVAYMMTFYFKNRFDWREVEGILAFASEVIATL